MQFYFKSIRNFILNAPFVLFFLILQTAGAQNSTYKFNHYTIEQGLSSNTVFSIIQDQDGYMWFGTINGFNKYDGYRIHQFKHIPSDTNSVSMNNAGNLFCDSDNYIWIGTWGNGVDRYDPRTGRFWHYFPDANNPTAIAGDKIQTIFEDSFGTIWFCSRDNGLSRLDRKNRNKGIFVNYFYHFDDPASISSMRVRQVTEDQNRDLWIATDNGLCRLKTSDREEGKFQRFQLSGYDKKVIYNVLYSKKSDILWLGTENGIFGLKNPEKIQNKILPDLVIHYTFLSDNFLGRNRSRALVVFEDSNKNIWIGTDSGGLIKLNPETGQYKRFTHQYYDPNSFSGNNVRTIFEDRSRNLWVGTYNHGINKLNLKPLKFHHFFHVPSDSNSLLNNNITAITKDHKNRLWIASYKGLSSAVKNGNNGYRFENNWLIKYLGKNQVNTIQVGLHGEIWFSTKLGLGRLNPETGKIKTYRLNKENKNQLFDKTINRIRLAPNGSLWLATFTGINYFDISRFKFSRFLYQKESNNNSSTNIIFDLLFDWKGRLWAGTGVGILVSKTAVLSSLNPDSIQFTSYKNNPSDPNSLVNNYINCLHWGMVNDKPVVWAGTVGGLSKISEDPSGKLHFKNYTVNDGLAHNMVCEILEDDHHNLWISTYNGISRFNPRTEQFTNYGLDDGLQSRYFSLRAGFKDQDGFMFFGGSNGFNRFHSDSIVNNPYKPKVVITDFKIQNKPIDLTGLDRIRLDYRQNFFSITFSALEYTAPQQNQFAYWLEGFNENWVYIGSQHEATFTNLSPGVYRFRVKACNNDGLWNETGTVLTIEIIPPFWKRTWFQIFSVLFGILAIVSLYKLRVRGIKKRNIALLNEIEERKRAQNALQKSEAANRRLATLVEQASESIVIINMEGYIEYVNTAFELCTGYSPDEAKGLSAKMLFDQTKNKLQYAELTSLLKKGETWSGNLYIRRKNGTSFIEEATIFPIKDENGLIVNICKIGRDVTRELELEQQIRQMQKMESIGTLAGGIAHDFNNLLTVINGYAEIALLSLKQDHPVHRKLAEIQKAGKRAEKLTQQLLAFSRKQIYKTEILSINRVIADMDNMLRRLIGEDIRIHKRLGNNLPNIKADKNQLEQIFVNLIVNARDAVRAVDNQNFDKIINIETGETYLDEGYSKKHPDAKPGHYVYFSVSDNGIGMDDEIKSRIFEPFFTTKEKFKGTGLGLSMVYGIVRQNNGSIHVYSEPNEGTIFKIYWPVTVEEKDDHKEAKIKNFNKNGGSETILFVEDEENVRQFASDALKSLGYNVLVASDGKEALELLRKTSGAIDLLITDLVMPNMNGKELAEKILQLIPEIKIIYVSGYTDKHITHNGLLDEDIHFIQKPYSISELAHKIRTILD